MTTKIKFATFCRFGTVLVKVDRNHSKCHDLTYFWRFGHCRQVLAKFIFKFLAPSTKIAKFAKSGRFSSISFKVVYNYTRYHILSSFRPFDHSRQVLAKIIFSNFINWPPSSKIVKFAKSSRFSPISIKVVYNYTRYHILSSFRPFDHSRQIFGESHFSNFWLPAPRLSNLLNPVVSVQFHSK